jgi:hypothetical protein
MGEDRFKVAQADSARIESPDLSIAGPINAPKRILSALWLPRNRQALHNLD